MESVRAEMKIELLFNEKKFEYDLYHLIQAFYPGTEISIGYDTERTETDSGGYANADGQTDSDGLTLVFIIDYLQDEIRFTTVNPAVSDGSPETESVPVPAGTDRTEMKNQLKKLVYSSLARRLGQTLPWGDLSGIRPVKLVTGLLENDYMPYEAFHVMQERYCVSDAKADLALRTAVREQNLLASFDYRSGYSLYVDIPFCPSICLYCTFGSHPIGQWSSYVEPYLSALEKELAFTAELMQGTRLDTIYIGGGTPTSITPEQMDRLLTKIQTLFPMESVREFTVEAGRPDTITREMLGVLKAHPVSRISINPQTMNQVTLERIGRNHTVADTIKAFHLAREMGFDHINMDMIVGLPGEGAAETAHTMREIEALGPDDFTVHSLALKRAARLNLFRDTYRPVSFENSAEIMDGIAGSAARMGMRPYYLYRQKNMAGNFENVGYARDKCACLYNILIMEEKQTIVGTGCGASTKRMNSDGTKAGRVENVKSLKDYLERTDEMCGRKERLFSEIQ